MIVNIMCMKQLGENVEIYPEGLIYGSGDVSADVRAAESFVYSE